MPSGFRIVTALIAAGIALTLSVAMAEQQRQPAGVAPSAPATTPPEKPTSGKRTEPRAVVTFKDGRLTVQVQNRSLEWVLERISQKAPVAIVRGDGVGSERVSLQIEDLPLDEALRRILAKHDAFFFYGVERQAAATVRVVWVYPRGRGRGLAPVPPEAWASTKEMREEAKTNPDPTVRARAFETLIERRQDQALDLVLEALQDVHEEVRVQALHAVLGEDVRLPADTLARLALTDPSHNVRFLALEALSPDPTVAAVAQQAFNDPHPHVRAKAQEILRRLDAADRPPEPRRSFQGQPGPRQ